MPQADGFSFAALLLDVLDRMPREKHNQSVQGWHIPWHNTLRQMASRYARGLQPLLEHDPKNRKSAEECLKWFFDPEVKSEGHRFIEDLEDLQQEQSSPSQQAQGPQSKQSQKTPPNSSRIGPLVPYNSQTKTTSSSAPDNNSAKASAVTATASTVNTHTDINRGASHPKFTKAAGSSNPVQAREKKAGSMNINRHHTHNSQIKAIGSSPLNNNSAKASAVTATASTTNNC